jgi:hypothetical protein
MVSDSLSSTPAKLPKRLRELLDSCPTKGNGVHGWLFMAALQLHRYFSEDEIVELLKEKLSCQRPESEIVGTVANAGRYSRGEMGAPSQKPWPAVDYTLVHKIVVSSPIRLKDLSSISPMDLSTEEPRTEEILDALYPGNPLLCIGRSVNACWTKPRDFWRGRESGFQFIVPNPMSKETGLTTDGKVSQRCIDTTGPRQFVVSEFDISEDGDWAPYVHDCRNRGITIIDANIALIIELTTRGLPCLPLGLMVHSGGKSMHAWCPCSELTDEQLRPFMAGPLGSEQTKPPGLVVNWSECLAVRGRMVTGSEYIISRQMSSEWQEI